MSFILPEDYYAKNADALADYGVFSQGKRSEGFFANNFGRNFNNAQAPNLEYLPANVLNLGNNTPRKGR